eukprot:m.97689 g.97689  ORF g.97689 m.97689 type:complete len:108 (-) comp13109_c0_seq1:254-577(-)
MQMSAPAPTSFELKRSTDRSDPSASNSDDNPSVDQASTTRQSHGRRRGDPLCHDRSRWIKERYKHDATKARLAEVEREQKVLRGVVDALQKERTALLRNQSQGDDFV